MKTLKLLTIDLWLEPFKETIKNRYQKYMNRLSEIESESESLVQYASGYNYYGLHKTDNGWVFREYAPAADSIFLVGTFNNWQEIPQYQLSKSETGDWELMLENSALSHEDLYKMVIYHKGERLERIPTYANRVVQDSNTYIFSAQVWNPKKNYQFKKKHWSPENKALFIYECHIGMATEHEKVGTFNEFRTDVLPRIKTLGYNVIQIMAIQEHPYYGSFGYHVSNFFAVSSRFGTPEELKQLIDEAHKMGIAVIMDIVHSHVVKNENEGIARLDGSNNLYFHTDHRREHPAWDSLCFDYGRKETLQMLLSNCSYWINEFGFDGYRFDGVTSMLYWDHGLGKAFTCYDDYFNGGQDEDAIAYLTLANKLIHQIYPEAITISEEMSGMPGLSAKVEDGGMGFDYRMAMGIPDYWIKLIKEVGDENWDIGTIFHELTNHRPEEHTINYAESHDQALVGDKTILFRLLDKEMYYHMHIEDQNMIVDRGIALHKMIRLITASTINGGYLNFMGNEFGHPEWIDFPRLGNNWSYHYARRQWSLVDNSTLKFKYLNAFDRDMIQLLSAESDFEKSFTGVRTLNQNDQVIAFQRKELIFVFNFNPTQSFCDYGFLVTPGKYKIVLNSDALDYGGFGLIDQELVHYTTAANPLEKEQWLKLYIPSRTALVLKRIPSKTIHEK